MEPVKNFHGQPVAWTKECVEQAIHESTVYHIDEKLSQLVHTYMPIEFVRANSQQAYRFICTVLRSDLRSVNKVRTLCVRMLREIDEKTIPHLCLLSGEDGGVVLANRTLVRLILPSVDLWAAPGKQLPLTGKGAAELVRYIYTDRISESLPVRDLLSIMTIAHQSGNRDLRGRVCSALFEALSHQHETLEERCGLLGISCLESSEFDHLAPFAGCRGFFTHEIRSLPAGTELFSINLIDFQGMFTDEEWKKIHRLMHIEPNRTKNRFSCLGPIRPRYLLPDFLGASTFESAVLRAVLCSDPGGLEIRLCSSEDVREWMMVCHHGGMYDASAFILPGNEGRPIRVRIEEIEVDEPLSICLRNRYAVNNLKGCLPCSNKCRTIVAGLTPFPGYLPYVNR